MPQILILILSTAHQRYADFIAACKSTWVATAERSSIRCLFYQGQAHRDSMDLHHVNLAADDSLQGTALKLLRCLKYIEHSQIEYDYIFRTNLSSYLFIQNFVHWVNGIQDEDLYAGVVGEYNLAHRWANRAIVLRKLSQMMSPNDIINFASGSGFVISRKNVQRVVSDKALDFSLIDDAMIGECLYRHGIPVTPVSRIDCNGNEAIFSADLWGNPERVKSCYHIRLKSKDRSLDVSRFYQLHQFSNFVDFYNSHDGSTNQSIGQRRLKIRTTSSRNRPNSG